MFIEIRFLANRLVVRHVVEMGDALQQMETFKHGRHLAFLKVTSSKLGLLKWFARNKMIRPFRPF